MKTAFNHENLKVYQNALEFNAKVEAWTAEWDTKHAICDHLPRAASSIVENIAMASASYSRHKMQGVEFALGSTLECAACLDLGGIKDLLEAKDVDRGKRELLELFKMLIGLRRAWSSRAVREDSASYYVVASTPRGAFLFHHEQLDVYRTAIEAASAFSTSESIGNLPAGRFRRLDVLLTSMVLNIAEGNGRFSESDQRRFLGTSHESSIKLAAEMDLCVVSRTMTLSDADKCKQLLARIASMTAAMMGRSDK